MFKKYFTLSITLITFFTYSQNISFEPNINHEANELEQFLDDNENLLVLESKTNEIQRVDIFNEEYSDRIDVNSNKTNIDLNTLPAGNFLVKAKIDQKWIVMSLQKKEHLKIATSDQRKKNVQIDLTDKTTKYGQNYFWVVSESNSNFGSTKTMRLEYKDDIEKLITKIELELQSSVGKNNTLTIYEVYDKSKFMDQQFRNPTYYKTDEASKFLNSTPMYASNNQEKVDF